VHVEKHARVLGLACPPELKLKLAAPQVQKGGQTRRFNMLLLLLLADAGPCLSHKNCTGPHGHAVFMPFATCGGVERPCSSVE